MIRRRILAALGASLLAAAVVVPQASAAPATGALFIASNQVSGNAILAWTRNADGSLTPAGSVATGGLGTGGGLGSQGAITLADGRDWLFAVNAASDSVSVFSVDGADLDLSDVVASGGNRPTSVTVHGNLVYVLNAGGDGNIAGFRLVDGALEAVPGSIRPLSQAGGTNPGQIEFSPDGRFVVVVERGTRKLSAFPIDKAGVAGAPTTLDTPGVTPFGFTFTIGHTLIVSEAASGSASSYSLTPTGSFEVREGAAPLFQAAPCWFVATDNGRFAYTTNAQSGSISGFNVKPNGDLTLLDEDGVTALFGPGTAPTDEAIAGGFLHADLSAAHELAILRIGVDGGLTEVGRVTGLPVGAVGLAAS
jgi:hypothetical protein